VRVLVLTNMYPPHAYGGYEHSCQDVVDRWRRRGHEVLVLTSTVTVPGVAARPEDPQLVRRTLGLYWEDHEILRPPPWRRWAVERANLEHFEAAVRDLRPEVVSAWAMGAMSMGLLTRAHDAGLPTVLVICDEWPVYGPMVDAWLRPLAHRPRLGRVVGTVTGLPSALPPLDAMGPACFVSAFLRDAVRRRSPWTFPRATVVHSGIDTACFPFHPRPERWEWRLLYVGRIDPRKGIDTAVRALPLLPPQASLAVCGHGDDRHRTELERLAADLGVADRVSFTSSARHDLHQLYADADAVVFPSTWEEPFGLVPVEAMACGTPVVATTVGGAGEFLADGRNCVTFQPHDAAGLAAALARLAGDPDVRTRVIDGGRATASRLSADRLADELEALHAAEARSAPGH